MTSADDRAPRAWRLLVDLPASGAWNMAVDEAVLDAYVRATVAPIPTLRLYGWQRPTLSLGKAQTLSPGPDLAYLRREGMELVRRPTGGRAVLHACERTYAVCGIAAAPFGEGIGGTYLSIAAALRAGFERLGLAAAVSPLRSPPAHAGQALAACFDVTSTYEITVGGRKLVGSAQLRRRGAFLQHGSILIRADERLAAALGSAVGRQRATDLATCLGREPGPNEIDRALVAGFAEHFGVRLRRSGLRDEEREAATRLYAWKYLSAAWTLEGKTGARERRWSTDHGAARAAASGSSH